MLTPPRRLFLSRRFLHTVRQVFLVAPLGLSALSCTQSPVDPASPPIDPEIQRIQVQSNPAVTLSALVTLSANMRGSVAIEVFHGPFLEFVTPSFSVERDSTIVPVLGLHESTTYSLKPILTSSHGGAFKGSPFTYTVGSLSADVPRLKVLISHQPTVRYVLLGITPAVSGASYAMIVDTAGSPVWIRKFKDAVVDFQKQSENRYTVWSSADGGTSHFYELDALGNIRGEYRASGDLATDPHELRMRGESYALFGIQFRTMDMRSFGGLPAAAVQGFVVEYHRPGSPPLLWDTFDHFDVTDAAPDISLKGQNVDPWHGNAIEIDLDGNLLVSFRNSDEITKIDAASGAIIWRLGGKHNQFTFRNDGFNGFSHQHGIRRLDNGNIILFDDGNLHTPQISRAVEYRLDEHAKTAELVWEYRPDPPLYGSALGFAQRLQNGNTLICFGLAPHTIEVDRNGTKRWELVVDEPQRYAYRAFSVESLY